MRPDFTEIKTGQEFKRWYWLKEELIEICQLAGLPKKGGKFALRDRIMHYLDYGEAPPSDSPTSKAKPKSRFNWARATLTPDTIITDNVSFGPNFRNFMKSKIGNHFSCHIDFMDWVKANPGKTLGEAVSQWKGLEQRKEDPRFKREIANHNMLNQYVRDFLEDNPQLSFKHALSCWKLKKELPSDNGFVRYAPSDLELG